MKVIGAQKREADDFELEMTMLIEQVVGHSVRLIDAVMKEANTHAVQLWALIDEDGDGIVSKDDFMDNYPRSQQKILNLIPLIASMAL